MNFVRIQDVYFTVEENVFETEPEILSNWHLCIRPKTDGSHETSIKLWGCFPTKEEGEGFLRDLEMLRLKYKIPPF